MPARMRRSRRTVQRAASVGAGPGGLLALLVTLGAVLAPAHAAAKALTYRTVGYRGISQAPKRTPARPRPFSLGVGRDPSVLVDEGGYTHVVWVQATDGAPDVIRYCRIPRGARACDQRQSLVPVQVPLGGGGPAFNTDSSGPRILEINGELIVLTHRFPNVVTHPDQSASSDTTYEWVSDDGGKSFTGPAQIGDNRPEGGAVVYDRGNPTIATITDGVTGGTFFQASPAGTYTSVQANLATGPDQAYSGTLGVLGDRPIAAFAGLDTRIRVRRWTGNGDPNDARTWTAPFTVRGNEPDLASGPKGAYLLNGVQVGAQTRYVTHRIARNGNSVGPARTIVTGSETQGRLFEDQAGELHAAWDDRSGRREVAGLRTSADGVHWSPTQTLGSATTIDHLGLSSAGDGGGAAVWTALSGAGRPAGPIEVSAFGTEAPAPGKGAGGVPPSGDLKATSTCETMTFGEVTLRSDEGCFLRDPRNPRGSAGVTNGPIGLNGLEIIPDVGAKIVIDPHQHTIDTIGEVTVELVGLSDGPLKLYHGQLTVRLPDAGQSVDLFKFDASRFPVNLEGFPIDGTIDVKLEHDSVKIPISLRLPAYLGGVHGQTTLVADQAHGLHLDSLEMGIDDALIGPLELDHLDVSYSSATDTWDGSGGIGLPPRPGGFHAAVDVRFAGGHFVHGAIEIKPQFPGIPIFTDVFIDSFGAALDLEPVTKITGDVGIGVIPVGPDPPPTFQVDGTIAVTFADPFRIEIDGTGSLFGQQIEQAHLLFVSNGYLEVKGGVDVELGPLGLQGSLDAVVDAPHHVYSAEFDADFQIADISLSQVAAIVSSRGIAVCGNYTVLTVTVGHHWGHSLTDIFPGFGLPGSKCDLSDYRVSASPARVARAAAAGTGVPVALPHAALVNVAVRGTGGAPSVVLTSPTGKRVTPSTDLRTAVAVKPLPALHGSVVVLRSPAAGTWHVSAAPGSPPMTSVEESHSLPPARVRAHVTGRGRKRHLVYSMAPRPGLVVQFAEIGRRAIHLLGHAKGARGTIAFAPADGPAGSRRIVALMQQDGLPRPQATVAHYTAPGPARPGPVRKLRGRRKGTSVTLTWHRPTGANSYAVLLRDSRGLSILRVLRARITHVTFRGRPRDANIAVRVIAISHAGHRGPARTVRLHRTRAPAALER